MWGRKQQGTRIPLVVFFASILVLGFSPFALASFEGIYERNSDRRFGERRSFQVAIFDECMQACDKAGNACVAFTFEADGGICSLMQRLYRAKEARGLTSGIKTSAFRYLTAEADTNRPGGDYRNFSLPDGNPALCAQACQDEQKCLAYTYVPPGNQTSAHCWLKDSKPEKRTAAGLVSGTKPRISSRRGKMGVQVDHKRNVVAYAEYEMVSQNHNVCRTLCGTLSSCESWTFVPSPHSTSRPGGLCKLHPGAGKATTRGIGVGDGVYSGQRRNSFELPRHPKAKTRDRDIVDQFDAQGFVERLRNRLNRFQGYALVAMSPEGIEVATLEDGYAIHPVTGQSPRRFTVNTPTRIGSISKAVTAVAVLRQERATPGFLDTRLGNNLPFRWRGELNSEFTDATFRVLLRHRSGIPNSGGSLRSVLGGPVSEKGPGNTEYSNYGVMTFNLTMAYALRPSSMLWWEQQLIGEPDAAYDLRIREEASSWYRIILQQAVAPANVKIACRTSDTSKPTYFYSENFQNYSAIDRTSPGVSDLNHHCAQGALVMSTRDLARLFHTVVNTNKIVSGREREFLLTPDDSKRVGLGRWKGYSPGKMDIMWHNGGHPGIPELDIWDGWFGSASELLIFPDGYVVAFNANSPQKEGESAVTDIIAAYHQHRLGKRTPLVP